MEKADVVIVGGGVSGLCCARRLCEVGIVCQVFEASDDVGGRVRSDAVDGFILDRGFQVLLTAYPEAQAILDYKSLDLKHFEPGALIRYRGKFRRFSDPWRRPQHALATAVSPVASLSDKFRIAGLRRKACAGSLDDLHRREEQTTLGLLRDRGFSERIIRSFFTPFLGGVFLEPELATSSRLFEFVFRMFSRGEAALPATGMGAIPRQIASKLPDGVVRLNAPVKTIRGRQIELESGQQISSSAVVVATEEPIASKLLGREKQVAGRSVCCSYFMADRPPIMEPILILNGDGIGPINNLCFPSQVSTSYAPAEKTLVSVTTLGNPALDDQRLATGLLNQLTDWFGEQVESWRHVKTYRIRYALPQQEPPALSPVQKAADIGGGIFVCGDYCDLGSLNGAMASGRRAANAVIKHLSHTRKEVT